MPGFLDQKSALLFLKETGCADEVILHCQKVAEVAGNLADRILAKGHQIDPQFVRVAALLHDIGRSRTQKIDHGIAGADILADYPLFARVCKRHIGSGITKDEAKDLGLVVEDYMPQTLEEKVIAHADNLVAGSKTIALEQTIDDIKTKLGSDHPQIRRTADLDAYIRSLIE